MKKITNISFSLSSELLPEKQEALEKYIKDNFQTLTHLEVTTKTEESLIAVIQVKDPEIACAGLIEISKKESMWSDFNKICSSFGVINILKEDIKNIRKKSETENDPRNIWKTLLEEGKTKHYILDFFQKARNAEIITKNKKFLLEEIPKFLIPLPKNKKFEKLHFGQKMIRAYLDLNQLLLQPQVLDGALKRAFTEYKKEYVEVFLSEYQDYKHIIDNYWKEKKEIDKQILALEALDRITELGKQESDDIKILIFHFFEEYKKDEVTPERLKEIIVNDGEYKNFYLGKTINENEFKKLKDILRKKLEKKLSKVQERSVMKVINKTEGDNVNKVIDLINLSKIEEIINILAKDKNGEIVFALRKIFF